MFLFSKISVPSASRRRHWYLVFRAFLVIVGGFLVHLTLGTIYTYGNMAPYIVSYIRNQSHPQNLKPETTTWVFAFALIGQGTAMFFGGWMIRKIGSRWTTLIGGWIMSLGVILSYFTIKVSFWLLLLTYGLLFGVGVGIAYIGPLTSAMKWLPKWKGLANGVVVAGFGLGALIFNTVQTTYINPHNLKSDADYFTDPDLLHHVPTMFLILGGSYAVIQLIGSLLITDPPEDYGDKDTEAPEIFHSGQYREIDDDSYMINNKKIWSSGATKSHKPSRTSPVHTDSSNKEPGPQLNGFGEKQESPDDAEDEKVVLLRNSPSPTYSGSGSSQESSPKRQMDASINSVASGSKNNVRTSLKPLQMLKKPSFYLLWCMFMANGLAVLFTAVLYKFFGLKDVVNNDHYLASVGSVAAIFNCLGRIVWGVVADKVSYKFALVLISGIMTAFLLTFYACMAGGKIMFFFWVCAIFFCIGGNFSVFPTAIARAFGLRYVSVNYGLLFTSQIVSGTLGAFLSTILKSTIGFSGLFFVVSGCSGFAFLMAIVYRPKRYISLN